MAHGNGGDNEATEGFIGPYTNKVTLDARALYRWKHGHASHGMHTG